jgi:YceI-like domain
MQTFGPGEVDCFVYVYREGALSAVGHDLELRITDFKLEVGGEPAIQAEFRAGSLRVAGVLKGGAVDEREPSARDRREIEGNIEREVLEAGRHPLISFRSLAVERTGEEARITGLLELHGVVREIAFPVRLYAGRAVARVTLDQKAFGIKPYRALLGALRVKPEVVVEVSVPGGVWPV